MTCSIPHDIEQRLTARAAKLQMTVEQLVVEASPNWYLGVEEETLDELAAWQQIRDEAGDLIEGQVPCRWRCALGRSARSRRGRATSGRPASIWQDAAAFQNSPTILLIPLTSRLDAQRFAGTFLVEPSKSNGLSVASVALVFQLALRIFAALGPS